MSQSYNNNTKRPKLKNTKLVILKIYTFCQKIKQKVSDPGESAAGVTSRRECCWGYVPKSYLIVHLKVAATSLHVHFMVEERVQLEHSSHIVKVGFEAIC